MDATTLQNQLTALRDGSDLERRLAQLDAKLGAWLAVVQTGHAALLELARKVVSTGAVREGRTPLMQPANADAAQTEPAPLTDEALLQTLDPETAQAIRVKRRLCSNSRSVRELLDEYQASQAAERARPQAPARRKRGWWRHDNG